MFIGMTLNINYIKIIRVIEILRLELNAYNVFDLAYKILTLSGLETVF